PDLGTRLDRHSGLLLRNQQTNRPGSRAEAFADQGYRPSRPRILNFRRGFGAGPSDGSPTKRPRGREGEAHRQRASWPERSGRNLQDIALAAEAHHQEPDEPHKKRDEEGCLNPVGRAHGVWTMWLGYLGSTSERMRWAPMAFSILARTALGMGLSTVTPMRARPPASLRPTSMLAMLTSALPSRVPTLPITPGRSS